MASIATASRRLRILNVADCCWIYCTGWPARSISSQLNIESTTRISGKRCTHGWASDKEVFFVLEFSRPFAAIELQLEGKAATASVGKTYSGEALKAIFTVANSTDPLSVRVGLSCTSVEGASRNLAKEVPHWNFDALVTDNQREWAAELSALDAELIEPSHREIFYTGAYHGLVAPATFNDVDGAFRGQDHQNHPNPGFTKYSVLSIWDIYRGEFHSSPLRSPNGRTTSFAPCWWITNSSGCVRSQCGHCGATRRGACAQVSMQRQ